jgi:transposase InsO family protein
VKADAPKVVWALDFQLHSTVDGRAIKIASMLDEHTRVSLMDIVERSITAQRLTEELDKAFALWGGPPLVLRMDNGPEFISHVLQQFCGDRVGICYIPPGTPWNNGHIESFNNRLGKECLNRNHWTSLLEAGGDRGLQGRPQPPALVPELPDSGRVRCPMRPHPPPRGWLRDRLTSHTYGSRTKWSD